MKIYHLVPKLNSKNQHCVQHFLQPIFLSKSVCIVIGSLSKISSLCTRFGTTKNMASELFNILRTRTQNEILEQFFLRNWSIGVSSSDCKKHKATLWSLLSRFILWPQLFSFVFPNVPFRLRRQRKKAEMKFWEVGSYALRYKLLIYIGKWQRALSKEKINATLS